MGIKGITEKSIIGTITTNMESASVDSLGTCSTLAINPLKQGDGCELPPLPGLLVSKRPPWLNAFKMPWALAFLEGLTNAVSCRSRKHTNTLDTPKYSYILRP